MGKEGAEVRAAFDGPQVDHDELIDFALARNAEDRARASSAGESREKIGEFIEETGFNGKALSMLRAIMKKADQDENKAMDIIRSLEKGLAMVKAHIAGQPDLPGMDEEPVEPAAPGKPSYDPDADFAEVGVGAASEASEGDDDIGEEVDAFEAQLAEVAAAAE